MPDPEPEIYEKKVRDVLAPTNLEFHAIIARLSVLFEDLRIEGYASRAERFEELYIIGKTYRKDIFPTTVARHTHGVCKCDRDARPASEFRKLKKRFSRDVQTRWDDAAKYFRAQKKYLSERRANFGGHFDHVSAKHAVKKIHPETAGQIVVVKHMDEEKGGVRLNYAMEIVGAAMTHHKPEAQEDREWFHDMFVMVRAGSNEAVKAIHTVSIMYLLERFGRDMSEEPVGKGH